jgi:PTS system nitrogen regulatory IIA component
MADLITPERVILTLYAANKLRVIEKLSCFAAARTRLDEELVRRALVMREDLTTFGVGRGIAIPHATVPGISEPLGAFARLKRPVDFGAADGRVADLVLLILAPEKDPGILLRALSCVARRLRDREVAKRLRAETSAEAAHVILISDSWRGHDSQPDWKHTA